MKYYLRIEGVNLDNYVYDINDLSTVRGGGLLMLKLAEVFEGLLGKYSCSNISVGASWGLFELVTEENIEQKPFLDSLNAKLADAHIKGNGQEKFVCLGESATWVLDLVTADNGFKIGRDQIHTMNRWRQMQSLSLRLPQSVPFVSDIRKSVCEFDMLRPAFKTLPNEKKSAISHHVSDRREYGRYMKQGFYEEQTQIEGLTFTEDLNHLTQHDNGGCSKSNIGNLNGKMAVIYLDGNSFGEKQRRLCDDENDQRDFNRIVKDGQKNFLTHLLQTIKTQSRWKNSLQNNSIRLETLLWGGDEIMWVVPAWQGWWLLELFFKMTETSKWKFKGEQLTHAAGMVFCHHNAPIHRIKTLAHDLAEIVKTDKEKDTGYVAYQILESFDHVGNNLGYFREMRCPPIVNSEELILKGSQMGQVAKNIINLKENPDFSKRKLYQTVQALYNSSANDLPVTIQNSEFIELPELQALQKILGKNASYLHVLELFDYIDAEDI